MRYEEDESLVLLGPDEEANARNELMLLLRLRLLSSNRRDII